MICRSVICSDTFIELDHEAQALYFQLTIEADNFGFVAGVKKIMRSIGVHDNALEALENARFVIGFNFGVYVIRHWFVANFGSDFYKNDRTLTTTYLKELAALCVNESGAYELQTDSTGTLMELQTDSIGSPKAIQTRVTQYINKTLARQTTTNTNPTYETSTEDTREHSPDGGGAGGGGLPPEILDYAHEAAQGAEHPAAYERAILNRIREAGFTTLEEVLADDRRHRNEANPDEYAQEGHFFDAMYGRR